MNTRNIFIGVFVFIFSCIFLVARAQDTSSADGLLLSARHAAFSEKNYRLAKAYLYKAISISSDCADIRIFLGRIYAWEHVYDSARYYFESALRIDSGYEDAFLAYTDLEYWNDHNDLALTVCRKGLIFHPRSGELLLRESKIYLAMKDFREADSAAQQVLHIDKDNTAARSIANRIRDLATLNKIGMSYDFVYFDRQFSDPWHLVSMEYGRSTRSGAVTGRINYANRFKENGVQYELDAYPHISKRFYSYVEVAYSDKEIIFPKWHAAFSLYGNLPSAWEGELGLRFLQFSGTPTWIYTAYLGKYVRNWLFGARTYLTPAAFSPAVSISYSLSARYYYGGADDLVGLSGGYGISPDDRYNVIQLDTKTKLTSYNLGFLVKKKIGHRYVLTTSGNYLNQEYLPKTSGNQFQAGLAVLYRF
jgi:YaiO family outer membrane protein